MHGREQTRVQVCDGFGCRCVKRPGWPQTEADQHRQQGKNTCHQADVAFNTFRPIAAIVVATMSLAVSLASVNWAAGELWSMKRSGNTIGRIFSPESNNPAHAKCCITAEPN